MGPHVLGSEFLTVSGLDESGIVKQIGELAHRIERPLSDRWLDEGMADGHVTNKHRREAESTESIGGLRSPHISVTKLQATAQFNSFTCDIPDK